MSSASTSTPFELPGFLLLSAASRFLPQQHELCPLPDLFTISYVSKRVMRYQKESQINQTTMTEYMLSYYVSRLKLSGNILGSVDFITPTATTATQTATKAPQVTFSPNWAYLHSVTSTKKPHCGYFKVDNTTNYQPIATRSLAVRVMLKPLWTM